jgi:hypothetical protein
VMAGHVANGAIVDLSNFHVQKPMILHLAASMKRNGMTRFTSALLRLQITRSKFAAELEGLLWPDPRHNQKTYTTEPR